MRRATAWLGTLALLMQTWLPLVHHPAFGTSPALWASPICHAGTPDASGNKATGPGGSDQVPSKGASCPICLALHASGNFVMPAGAAIRFPPERPAIARIGAATELIVACGPRSAQPRGPPLTA